jgi:hypothetical protein
MMVKLQDWQVRFEQFIADRAAAPFTWGTNDCAIFAADCVLAITGHDVALPALRRHKTELQAARVLKRHGGVVGIATAAMGQPVPASGAGVGDVVLAKSGRRDMLAICNGATCIAPGVAGLAFLPMPTDSVCWRIA